MEKTRIQPVTKSKIVNYGDKGVNNYWLKISDKSNYQEKNNNLEKIVNIIESIAHEKGLKIENVKEALKIAMIRTAKKIYGEDKVFDLSLGNPDLPPPEEVKQTLEEMVKDYRPEFHRYMPNAGFPFVREVMAEKVSKEQGVKIKPEDIIMTCGAAGALNVIFKTLLNPGEEVLFPSPFFVEYFFYAENHHGIPKPVPLKKTFLLILKK